MTRILVCSDSHGRLASLEAAVLREKPTLLFHLGDHDRDLLALRQRFPLLPCQGVSGNCDPPGGMERLLLRLEDVTLLLVHGHRQRVKQGLMNLYLSALEAEATVALFGHTHLPLLTEQNDVTLLNPGSIGTGNYALLTLSEGSAKAELRRI